MQLTSLSELNCSIAKTLDVVGEWWTLLIVRDALRGTRRFDDFQASLGLARSVLTARLRKLTEAGILDRQQYSQRPPRYEYRLTDKGRALFPVIVALMRWGDDWEQEPAGPPTVLVHDTCGQVIQPVLTCPHCRGEVGTGNTHSEPGPGRQMPASTAGADGQTTASRTGALPSTPHRDGAGRLRDGRGHAPATRLHEQAGLARMPATGSFQAFPPQNRLQPRVAVGR